MNVKAEYLVDEKGQKRSVILPIKDYLKLWEYLEDLEDALDLKKAKETAKEFIDLENLIQRLKKQKRIH